MSYKINEVKRMIHRPQSIKELIGRIEIMAKLYEAWNNLTRLYNETLKIFKEDYGMDRFREDLLHRAKEKIPEIRILIEQVIDLFKKDIEELK